MSSVVRIVHVVAVVGALTIGATTVAEAAPVTLVFDVALSFTCPWNIQQGDPACALLDDTFELTAEFLDPPELTAHSAHHQQAHWPVTSFSEVPLDTVPNPLTGTLTTDDKTVVLDKDFISKTDVLSYVFLGGLRDETRLEGSWSSYFYLTGVTVASEPFPLELSTLDDLIAAIDGETLDFWFFTFASVNPGEFLEGSRYYSGTARLNRAASVIPDATPPVVAPEPTSTALLGVGLALAFRRRRSRRARSASQDFASRQLSA